MTMQYAFIALKIITKHMLKFIMLQSLQSGIEMIFTIWFTSKNKQQTFVGFITIHEVKEPRIS